jgi:hypothetical protein
MGPINGAESYGCHIPNHKKVGLSASDADDLARSVRPNGALADGVEGFLQRKEDGERADSCQVQQYPCIPDPQREMNQG